jgi:hypothetical protein
VELQYQLPGFNLFPSFLSSQLPSFPLFLRTLFKNRLSKA